MKKQLSHQQSPFENKAFPVVLILDNITGEANIGSIFRLADAFNIEKLVFCEYPPNLKSNRLKKTARNTHNTVDFEFWEHTSEAIDEYLGKDYLLYSLEITSDSIPVDEFSYSENKPIALVLGNEAFGIKESILHKSHKCLHINMYGANSSMNVAQATGIALYEITKTIRAFNKK